MQLRAEFEDPQVLSDTPLGARRILHFKRGAVPGPKLEGQLLPGGADWVLMRRDGVAQLDIRFTLRTNDGELIYVNSSGISDIAPTVRERIANGEDVNPEDYYFRTVLTFETGAEKYRWLNRLLAVGSGKRTAVGIVSDIFAIK